MFNWRSKGQGTFGRLHLLLDLFLGLLLRLLCALLHIVFPILLLQLRIGGNLFIFGFCLFSWLRCLGFGRKGELCLLSWSRFWFRTIGLAKKLAVRRIESAKKIPIDHHKEWKQSCGVQMGHLHTPASFESASHTPTSPVWEPF